MGPIQRTPPRARRVQTSTRASCKPGQRRSTAKETMKQRVRPWNEASDELHWREQTRVGVTNPFTDWGRNRDRRTDLVSSLLRKDSPVQRQIRCWVSVKCRPEWCSEWRCRIPTTSNSSVHQVRTTLGSIGCRTGERTRATELYTNRTTPTSADEKRRANDDNQRQLIDGDRTVVSGSNQQSVAVGWSQRPGGNWVRAGDVDDDRWTARFHECCPHSTHSGWRRRTSTGHHLCRTNNEEPELYYCPAGQTKREFKAKNPLVTRDCHVLCASY